MNSVQQETNVINMANLTINGMRLAGMEVTADGYKAKAIGGACGRTGRRQLNYITISGDEANDILSTAESHDLLSEVWRCDNQFCDYSFDLDAVADWVAGQVNELVQMFEAAQYEASEYGLGAGLEL